MSFCRWPHASASPALSKWTARQSDTTTVLSHAYEHYAAAAPVSKEIAKPFSFVFFFVPVSVCVHLCSWHRAVSQFDSYSLIN